jgi:hypothetical protein
MVGFVFGDAFVFDWFVCVLLCFSQFEGCLLCFSQVEGRVKAE